MFDERKGFGWFKWAVAAFLAWFIMRSVGSVFLQNYVFDFGGVNLPGPRVAGFLSIYAVLGTLSAAFLTVALVQLSQNTDMVGLRRRFEGISDGKWQLLIGIFALLIPLLLHHTVLFGGPLTDDEAVYEFMGKVLAGGKLYADSHALKLFFDRIFMVNDGHFYSQYFLGWPALMAPGVWIGNTALMNPLYCALTVPGLYYVFKRLVGMGWARVGTVLYLLSPMFMVGAATKMSHTTCMAALIYTTLCFLKTRDPDAKWYWHGLFALSFSIAFFIRPLSALGLGLPLLVSWAWLQMKAKRGQAMVVFMVPALLFAGAFLAVNKAQTGSYTQVAYQRTLQYYAENEFRYAPISELPKDKVANMSWDSPFQGLALSGALMVRLNGALFGWPCSLLFAFLAGFSGRARLWWLCLLSFGLFHYFLQHVGVDTFAPVHFYETAWVWMILSLLGLSKVRAFLQVVQGQAQGLAQGRLAVYPIAAVVALSIVGLTTYTPIRMSSIARIGENYTLPIRTAQAQQVHNAVVFSSLPYAPNCLSAPTRFFIFWRPMPSPDLKDDILWVNHLSVQSDKKLMEHFPDRKAYVQLWKEESCKVFFAPLDKLEPGSIPDGSVGGSGRGLEAQPG